MGEIALGPDQFRDQLLSVAEERDYLRERVEGGKADDFERRRLLCLDREALVLGRIVESGDERKDSDVATLFELRAEHAGIWAEFQRKMGRTEAEETYKKKSSNIFGVEQ